MVELLRRRSIRDTALGIETLPTSPSTTLGAQACSLISFSSICKASAVASINNRPKQPEDGTVLQIFHGEIETWFVPPECSDTSSDAWKL